MNELLFLLVEASVDFRDFEGRPSIAHVVVVLVVMERKETPVGALHALHK